MTISVEYRTGSSAPVRKVSVGTDVHVIDKRSLVSLGAHTMMRITAMEGKLNNSNWCTRASSLFIVEVPMWQNHIGFSGAIRNETVRILTSFIVNPISINTTSSPLIAANQGMVERGNQITSFWRNSCYYEDICKQYICVTNHYFSNG
jgi:hypothetical protein